MSTHSKEAIEAEKQVCDELWKARGVRGDAEWPRDIIRTIIQSAIDERLAAEREAFDRLDFILNAEHNKCDNLFKVSRKHCVENQELKKDLAAKQARIKSLEQLITELPSNHELAAEREKLEAAVDVLKKVQFALRHGWSIEPLHAEIDAELAKMVEREKT